MCNKRKLVLQLLKFEVLLVRCKLGKYVLVTGRQAPEPSIIFVEEEATNNIRLETNPKNQLRYERLASSNQQNTSGKERKIFRFFLNTEDRFSQRLHELPKRPLHHLVLMWDWLAIAGTATNQV